MYRSRIKNKHVIKVNLHDFNIVLEASGITYRRRIRPAGLHKSTQIAKKINSLAIHEVLKSSHFDFAFSTPTFGGRNLVTTHSLRYTKSFTYCCRSYNREYATQPKSPPFAMFAEGKSSNSEPRQSTFSHYAPLERIQTVPKRKAIEIA